MEIFNVICELVIPILIFGILFVVGKLIYKKLDNSESRLLNPSEYLPEQELETLKQVYYLIMMLILFIFIIYITSVHKMDVFPIAILQIVVSVYIALTLDYSSWNNRILFFLLVPYESIILFVFNQFLVI